MEGERDAMKGERDTMEGERDAVEVRDATGGRGATGGERGAMEGWRGAIGVEGILWRGAVHTVVKIAPLYTYSMPSVVMVPLYRSMASPLYGIPSRS